MFTGLIQRVGRIVRLERGGAGGALAVGHEPWAQPLDRGESVAVQGVCLTVRAASRDAFECDVALETLARTSFAGARAGAPVNLERAIRAGDPLGGHIVQGHVDGVGRLREMRREGRDWRMIVECDRALLDGLVPKGSVACDGVSLTVARLAADSFETALIPTTWTDTALSSKRPGDAINIETDVIGKYVIEFLRRREGSDRGVTLDTLLRNGLV